MTVYVDQPLFRLGRMRMCHMWADDVGELHAMAVRIGLRRSWFQSPPAAAWEHYDVCLSRRAAALTLGAVETDRYGAIEWDARRSGDVARLASVARVRGLRARVHHPGPGMVNESDAGAIDASGPDPATGDGRVRRRSCPT